MSEATFNQYVFQAIEQVTRSELNNRSRQLVRNYIESSRQDSHAARAREAVRRYCQAELPTVEDIRAKSRTARLGPLDHLVLKFEHEGARLDGLQP